jgi:dihydroxyacetone kinase-like protein
MNASTLCVWLELASESLDAQSDYLTQLDAAIGDADHGVNMTRGFSAVVQALEERGDADSPRLVLERAGTAVGSGVGGASGALWGTALKRASGVLGDSPEFDGETLAAVLEEALAAVTELGSAVEGDKTMVDALAPAVNALREALVNEVAIGEAMSGAVAASEAGVRATSPMRAMKGRASYLGERSIGHQDPGATSTALILKALEEAISRAP